MGFWPARLHSIPPRIPGMPYTVRRSCVGYESVHALVSGRRLLFRLRSGLGSLRFYMLLAVTCFTVIQVCATFRTNFVFHVLTSLCLAFMIFRNCKISLSMSASSFSYSGFQLIPDVKRVNFLSTKYKYLNTSFSVISASFLRQYTGWPAAGEQE